MAVKAVIWDLDDTLWDGTLAESERVQVRAEFAALIGELDARGIVNSVCSKNEYAKAVAVLDGEGISQYLVFPDIAFAPKGQRLAALIADLQLRSENVLFVDDNASNRQEASFYCPGILVADPNEKDFLPQMRALVQGANGTSRLQKYRILEKKRMARHDATSNDEFLADSEITICIIRNPADLSFRQRIIELANRSNQLNFTKSRFTDGEFDQYVAGPNSIYHHHGAIFVRDKFGVYGLVGFFGFDERRSGRTLQHFYFSCRVMDMGVEGAVYQWLRDTAGIRDHGRLSGYVKVGVPYQIIHEFDEGFADSAEESRAPDAPVGIVAGCTAGVLEHYLPGHLRPAKFENYTLARGGRIDGCVSLIYAIYQDYVNTYWPEGFSQFALKEQLRRFLTVHSDLSVILILGSERSYVRSLRSRLNPLAALARVAPSIADTSDANLLMRVKMCNGIVREVAASYDNARVVETTELVRGPSDQIDPRHFERDTVRRISLECARLLAGFEHESVSNRDANAIRPQL